jgi:hypothetical protein
MTTRSLWSSVAVACAAALFVNASPERGHATVLAAVACENGVGHGGWDLPSLGQDGTVDGNLFIASTTAPRYHFHATLIDVPSPCLSCIEGDIHGVLDDGVGTGPDYIVVGHYSGGFFTGRGIFHAKVFDPTDGTLHGRLRGRFNDPPVNTQPVGSFLTLWEVCP